MDKKIQLTAVRDEKYRYELDKLHYYAKGCPDIPGADKSWPGSVSQLSCNLAFILIGKY